MNTTVKSNVTPIMVSSLKVYCLLIRKAIEDENISFSDCTDEILEHVTHLEKFIDIL